MKRNQTVNDVDHRQLGRDSLFLMADLRLAGQDGEHRVKVRNLSAGGMMAEGHVKVARGLKLDINLRNIGWVEGFVAWVQDNRFGIAFAEDIEPKVAREPLASAAAEGAPRFVRPMVPFVDPSRIRKI
ncbi:PilZ domain-containing protein [Novosphingobium sp. Chol11]|uniref:PilZ domain-containing protein n=1 Tax=Novosphingobium sp. Chol11 TaxID=1385763 RepID=UPI0025DAB613|nr:PilZ domain-containing protein [Novosphingobium sp. Chol11]